VASYLNNGVKTPQLFTSPQVNQQPKEIPAEMAAQYKGKYLDQFYAEVNFNFACPHFLFLSGVDATYGEAAHAFTFKFTCSLLELAPGNYVQKAACDETFSPADNLLVDSTAAKNSETSAPLDIPAGAKTAVEGKSRCNAPGQFIHGFSARKYNDQHLLYDAFTKASCCSATDSKGGALVAMDNCTTTPAFPAATSFTMRCGDNMILKAINSTFNSAAGGRSYTFTCCQVGSKGNGAAIVK
jgi:hypothetical protein